MLDPLKLHAIMLLKLSYQNNLTPPICNRTSLWFLITKYVPSKTSLSYILPLKLILKNIFNIFQNSISHLLKNSWHRPGSKRDQPKRGKLDSHVQQSEHSYNRVEDLPHDSKNLPFV